MAYSSSTAEPPLSSCPEPIAIVGMGCRWPGGVRNPSQLWDLLKEERDGWSEFPKDRINVDGFYHPDGQRPGSMYTRGGHLLQEDTRDFDHSFFGITATEAMALDPSQRKLVEVTYEAVESAGVPFEKFFGSRTGVFVGNFNNEHQMMQYRDPDHTLPYVVTGGGPTILSNRLNYVFNLTGPSLMVDTACSASMYALHLAVTSIRNGDCDAAIVAGANVILGPDNQLFTTKLGAVSPTSRCHTFDIAADGYSRAEGFGAIYLKRLSDAVDSGDPIRAVVRGTSFNANGKTGGISHPSPDGQEAVIRQAYKAAGGLNPDLTGYTEAHGTGTPVGDPIEVSAIGRVFSPGRKDDPLLIGSIKPNLGHSEAASAMSQVMKAILAMEHGEIPATVRIKEFNPAIDFETARVKVVTGMTPWPSNRLRRVSINSFGYGGANAHAILDHPSVVLPGYKLHGLPLSYNQIGIANGNGHYTNGNGHSNGNGYTSGNGNTNGNGHTNGNGQNEDKLCWSPQRIKVSQIQDAGVRQHILLPFSAHDERALKENMATVAKCLGKYDLADLVYTLGCRKSTFARRAFAIADSSALREELDSDSVVSGKAPSTPSRRIGFVFTGQGAQWPQMGAELIHEYAVFRRTIRYLDSVLGKLKHLRPSWSIEEALLEPAATSQIHNPAFSQTICTALQIGLVTLLRQWGIEPVATVGHSSGEIAAAYTAGRLKASEAIVLAYFRGQVVITNQRKGLMMAVGIGEAETRPYLEGIGSDVKIAAVNSPNSVTLSGEPGAITKLSKTMTEGGIFARVLKTGDNAYHSHHMAALGPPYEDQATEGLDDVGVLIANEPRNSQVRWFSSVTLKEEIDVSPAYWRRNLESPVLFSPAVEKMVTSEPVDLLIEIGPHPALSGPVKQLRSTLEGHGVKVPPCLGSLRRGEHDVQSMLTLAGNLFVNNAPIDLVAVNANEKLENGMVSLSHGFTCIDLPQYKYSYPDQPVHYENRFNREYRLRKHLSHDLLGARIPGGSRTHPQWRNVLRLKDVPWLEDHKLLPHAVLPGAAYLTMAIEAISQLHHEAEEAERITSYKLRQVAINSALRVEDTELGVEIVLDMERLPLNNAAVMSQWYKFTIGSILPNSDTWTQHCTGIISVTTAETTIDRDRQLRPDPRSRSLDMSRWYKRFWEAGLGYGPAFEGLSELKAYRGTNTASAKVALSPTANLKNESCYPIHPGTLDTMIQLALISCHAGQVESFEKAFVPIFADDVTVWVPEGNQPQGLGIASGQILGLRSMYSQAQLYSFSGSPLLDIGELKCVTYEGIEDESASSAVREPYWRPVSRPDVDTLTPSITRDMFPAKEIDQSVIVALETLSAHVLASIGETLRSEVIGDGKTQNHDAFAEWVRSWNDSSNTHPTQHLSKTERLAEIQRLSMTMKHIPEARCLSALHDNLGSVLKGDTNSVKLLMEDNLMTDLFSSGITLQGGYSQVQHIVDLLAHKNPRMRILEVGAGTGGLTSAVLDTLASKSAPKRLQDYVFTDHASWSIPEAQARFSGQGALTFQTLDILQDPISQGFEGQSFDLVIATSLSELQSPATALKHMKALLRPSGSAVLLETMSPTLTSEILSRTLTGKWEQESISPPECRWERTLQQCGFSGVDLSLQDYTRNQHMTTAMLSKAIDTKAEVASKQSSKDVYLVYRDSLPLLAEAVTGILKDVGVNIISVEMFSGAMIPKGSSIISLIDADGSILTCRDEAYFEALQAVVSQVSEMVWVASDLSIHGESAIMKGVLRSIATENVLSKYAFIELDHREYTPHSRAAELILHKLGELQASPVSEAVDLESVLRGGIFYIERLFPEATLNEQFNLRNGHQSEIEELPMSQYGPLMARYRQPGLLSSLYFSTDPSFKDPLDNNAIEIKTEAIGLNMKDLAVATAKFDLDKLSTEGAGIVTRVGSGVDSFKIGDRVFGMIPGNMGNYLRSPAALIARIPEGLSFESAASMPVVYLTAIYAFHHLARLSAGESVLIQSATGGLGMAAIRVALLLGAEIYATVGTPRKRKVLIEEFGIPDGRIFNSRDLSAVDEMLQATGQRGFDVILSSTGGDSMHEMWRCIAPLGRFIDVGRTDVLGGGRLGLEVFKRNATFSSFDLGLVYRQRPELIARLMEEMTQLLEYRVIGPIEHLTTYDISQLEGALNTFSKGLHSGKFVITFRDPETRLKIARSAPRATFDPDAAYLLVGALGGLGRSLAAWMVERGARHLVFISRSGISKPEAVRTVQELLAAGAEPEVISCDVTDRKALITAIGNISKSRNIKGVIHAAMVEGDALFSNATWNQIQRVLAPKVAGTVNLHHVTERLPLDFFIMTSSIVGTVGTPSQGAYTAANAFQDAFAKFRQAQSLPATSIGLGLILEVGSVSTSTGFQQMLQRNATYGVSETEFLQLFEGALCDSHSSPADDFSLAKLDPSSKAQVVTGLEPGRFVSYLDNGRVEDLVWYNRTRFQAVRQGISDRAQALKSASAGSSAAGSSVALQLQNASSSAEKLDIARAAVTTRLADLLGIEADDVDADKPVSRYGVDSLVAGELRNWLIKTFGLELTMLQLLNKSTRIDDLIKGAAGIES
ncbi:putative polyketide synthase [Xylaria bambusicola]|uniref:putative polyketide synthase n=1 Tax=Xylaria bambusicola TaxID=326684 RepID=UPI0020085DC9|nr:putative polyketide synthase [Xylaria bambusicola]KAI0508449.1 putative polyketide synthase [Xylaria bambusicola]